MAGLPWVKVDAHLPTHPKTIHLASLVGGDANAIAGLVQLWLWASQNAPTGVVLGPSASYIIERAAGWIGEREQFANALRTVGWIDAVESGFRLHDWGDHQGAHLEKAASDRSRMREHRVRVRERNAKRRGKREREIEIESKNTDTTTSDPLKFALEPTAPEKPVSPLVAFLRSTYPDVKDPWGLEAAASKAYPGVDLLAEALKALAWEKANPAKAKTQHGRFLNTWWGQAQDRVGHRHPPDRLGFTTPGKPEAFGNGGFVDE